MNKTHNVAAVNSINWARILAQITYYFHSYFSVVKSPNYTKDSKIRFVVPSGNFGDILYVEIYPFVEFWAKLISFTYL